MANATGWSRDFILWELPLAQGHQLQHAVLYHNGVKTIEPVGALQEQLDEVTRSLH